MIIKAAAKKKNKIKTERKIERKMRRAKTSSSDVMKIHEWRKPKKIIIINFL